MISGSLKGRNRKARPPVAVPITDDVVERLEPALTRSLDENLLQRWGCSRKPGSKDWIRDKREPWKFAYETSEYWMLAVAQASLPATTVMYALRHSSIVRMLLKNIPVRVVAAQHDTSIEMIEKHYAAFITDMSETMARTATLSLTGAAVFLEAAE